VYILQSSIVTRVAVAEMTTEVAAIKEKEKKAAGLHNREIDDHYRSLEREKKLLEDERRRRKEEEAVRKREYWEELKERRRREVEEHRKRKQVFSLLALLVQKYKGVH